MSEQIEDREVVKMLLIVVGVLVGFFIVILILAQLVTAPNAEKMGIDKMVESATIDRIKPVGQLNVGSAPVKSASAGVDAKAAYTASCFACHGTGAAGAPKLGDKGAWKNRISQGMGTLVDHAINGFKGMPPRGGSSLDDAAVKAVVKYMVDGSK